MSEELKTGIAVPGEQLPEPKQPESQVSDVEQRALEMGWRPKEEFDGDDADFIDAKEFVRRAPLFEKIQHQSRELRAVKDALDAFKQHYTKVQETEYQRALRELKNASKLANREGDFEKADQLERHAEQVEAEAATLRRERDAIVTEPAQIDPRFGAWVNKNPWYQAQPHMRVYADQVGTRLAAQGVAPDEVLKLVEQEVRREFPTKFRNPAKDAPGAVEGGSRRTPTTKRDSDVELTAQEKEIMNTLVRGGHITKEKYIADLKAVKG